ncbi:hypothetical protein VZT92_004604 [Zoarces viviparus]|uniref:Helitron helicase-like domain-containing protein n=1 Tax=Zoarces viviparus TaxID=48416 RepID=A0AAW1FYF6_ZOAVI
MRMFDKRVEALYRDLLLSPAQPLGKVVDYFYRVEFQHRGSPHIHSLIWVEGAPVFEKDDDQTVSDYVSKCITAQLPDPHLQPELYKKVEAPVSALIAAVYRPPDYSVRSFLSNLGSLLDSLEIMDCQPIIVCGDFNENCLSNTSKPIFELFQSRGYAQVITTATTEKNTLLDLIFISQPQHCLHSGVMKTYYSYHNPVYCVMSSNSP